MQPTINRGYIRDLLPAAGEFLADPETWNTSLAVKLAQQEGLRTLTPEHWRIIRALRVHFDRFGIAPPAFCHICRQLHLDPHCVEHLFHSDRIAWRVAGLPDPGEEARAYM